MATFFADKSKVLLEVELDSPNVTTVQTLLLLSSHEATNGHDARVWLYSGKSLFALHELVLIRPPRNGHATCFRSWYSC